MRNPKLLRNHPKIKKLICILLTLALLLPLGVSAPVYAGTGTSWKHVGSDINVPETNPTIAPTELSISNGIPYVAYLEPAAPGGSAEARLGDDTTGESAGRKAVVKKLVEDTWVTLDGIAPGEEEPDGFVTGDIVIDFSFSVFNDTPYIAYTTTIGSGFLITIMKYAEDSGWEKVTDIEANRLIGMDLSVANDIPYLAFADAEEIYIFKCNDEEIVFVGESLSIPQAKSLSLQCNESGTKLYVSYNNAGFIEVLERSSSPADEEEWVLLGGEALSEVGSDPSLFVYNQTPFVAYKENETCIVKSFSDSQWRQLGNLVEDSAIENISLYVDSSGQNFTPYLAYEGTSSYATVLKYNSSSNQWGPVTGSNSHASTWIISGLSLAANNGIPYVSYIQSNQVMVMNYVELPSFSAHPQDQTVTPGQDVTFSVTAAGTAPLSYQWLKNGTEINGENAQTLTITNVMTADAGDYTCRVTNGSGSKVSNAAALTVTSKDGDWQIVGKGSVSPSGVKFTSLSVYEGIPYVAFTDYFGSYTAAVKKFVNNQWESVGNAYLGDRVKTGSLYVSEGKPYLAYLTETNELHVIKYNADSSPAIWETLGTITGLTSANQVSLYVYEDIPFVVYNETEGRIAVKKFQAGSTSAVNVGSLDAWESDSITFATLKGDDQGNLYLSYQMTNYGYSSIMAVKKEIQGGNWDQPGGFVSPGNASHPSLAVYNGIPYVAYTDMSESGPGAINYGQLVRLKDGSWLPASGAHILYETMIIQSLVIDGGVPYVAYCDENIKPAVVKLHEGSWVKLGSSGYAAPNKGYELSLSVSNAVPYISYSEGTNSNIKVAKYLPISLPVISTQPTDKVVLEGDSAAFSVSTSGDTPLTYQWQKDGDDLPGATSSYYSISSVASSDAGRYSCRITNAGGTIKTREATLTVKEAGTLGLTAKAGNKQVTLAWDGFPGAGGYTVYKDNVAWSDVGGNSFTMRNLLNGTTYQFEVRALSDDFSVIGSSEKIDVTPFGVPEAPTHVTASSGNGQATITFQEPEDHGDSPITGYKVTSSPGGIIASGTGTSITVTGLTNGTSYTFIVNAINSLGEGNDSDRSNAVTPAAPDSHSGGGSGGGNGGGSPTKTPAQSENGTIIVNGVSKAAGTSQVTTDTDGRKTTTITVDSERLKELLAAEKSGATVTIPVKNGSAAAKGILTGEMVKNMESKEAVLIIQTDQASYTLPASQINIDKVSGQLGKNVSLSEIAVTVTVSEPAGTMSKVIENAAKQGGFSVVAPSVDFTISGTYKGATVNVSAFNTYVDRLVAIPAGVDPERITTGVVVTPKGSTYHVPTQVVVINGVYYAKINSLTNSTYSVIWNPLEFADVAKHWSKDSVNNMGSRMVVNGVGGGNYDPNRSITRAEFAAIIVRALGLAPGNGTNNFSDVATSAWYGGYIETASSYGIIKGYDNGKFGPQDTISREQAMAMLARAMKITGLETALTTDDVNQLTAAYIDGPSISAYAKEASAACLKSGIVAGRSSSTIAPKSSVTRAEVAAMMERLLQKSDLI